MSVIGIVAEFNPLHSGHKMLIDYAKKGGNTVVCTISGNFVQRGDTAIIPKIKRAQEALLCGVDIVAELPVLWSMSTAQNFCMGAVWQLYSLGCDKIIFGSETGDIEKLNALAELLLSDEFKAAIANETTNGITFAKARENAVVALGGDAKILENPNDNLGIEYIIAAKKLGIEMEFECIKRIGAGHNDSSILDNTVSSSFIRERLLSGDIAYAERFMPIPFRGFIKEDNISNIKRIENALLGILRLKNEEDFASLPDLSEGIENKLYFSVKVSNSLDELYQNIKAKRYTLSRVRRLVLSAALGFSDEFFLKKPPYVRVLGFSPKGEKQLQNISEDALVVTRARQIKDLGDMAKKVFDTECKATDLYALSLGKIAECGAEYKYKLLKTEE